MVEKITRHEYVNNVGALTLEEQKTILRDLEYITSLNSLEDKHSKGKIDENNDEARIILIQREKFSEDNYHEIEYSVKDNEITEEGVIPFAFATYTSKQIQELRVKDKIREKN